MTWGLGKWGGIKWGESLIVPLTSVTPTVISEAGGEIMVLSGTFPTDRTVQVHIGPLGTTEDPLCYGGQGLGYTVQSEDGATVEFVTPPLATGAVAITVSDPPATGTLAGINVVQRVYPEKRYKIRSWFPPWDLLRSS